MVGMFDRAMESGKRNKFGLSKKNNAHRSSGHSPFLSEAVQRRSNHPRRDQRGPFMGRDALSSDFFIYMQRSIGNQRAGSLINAESKAILQQPDYGSGIIQRSFSNMGRLEILKRISPEINHVVNFNLGENLNLLNPMGAQVQDAEEAKEANNGGDGGMNGDNDFVLVAIDPETGRETIME